MPAAPLTFRTLDGEQAKAVFGELRALYTEVYAEPPYQWGQEHADLLAERFEVQRRQEGFALAEARDGTDLVGFAFGVIAFPAARIPGNRAGPRADTRMHARLSGKRQGQTAPGTGTRTPVKRLPTPSLAPIPVRYASVDSATQHPTALQGDTPRDREKTPR